MRKKEFLKKSEARILVYLSTVAKHLKFGTNISKQLAIDYIYVMKLIRAMYEKEWIKVYKFDERSYFEITDKAPIKTARVILINKQSKLKNLYKEMRA